MKPMHTITKDVSVGIWNNEEYIARIYKDKVIVVSPYVKWINDSGNLDYRKESIRDQKTVDRIIKELDDDCEDTAWEIIGSYLQDTYLAASGF